MNFQNFVWNIEESHKHLLKQTISKGQYQREIQLINKRMEKSGIDHADRLLALHEGEQNAIDDFKRKAANE